MEDEWITKRKLFLKKTILFLENFIIFGFLFLFCY